MKRIIQGLVLATLITTAQASPFPGNGDPVELPPVWTHADNQTGPVTGSSFPGNGDPVELAAQSTYADAHAGEPNTMVGSAIAGNGDPVSLDSLSTYADRYAMELGAASRQAALSE